MDKQNLIACLEEKGYAAEIKDSIPYVRISCKSEKDFQKQYKEYGQALNELGYNSSFGAKAIFN